MAERRPPLALDDCICPVCLEIFLEPVTLPCTHTFCKSCFLESVDKSTLCCPLCRKRVSTWARHHSRTNSLVNRDLWEQVQSEFPDLCQRRLSGQDTVPRDLAVCFPRVSEPGEVRQEYQEEVSRLREEMRQLDEQQRQASEAYISQLLQEEQRHLQEEQRTREADERLARVISHQLNSPDPLHVANSPPPPRKRPALSGQIDRFLCPLPIKLLPQTGGPAPKCASYKENRLLPVSAQHGPEVQPAAFCRPLLDRNQEGQTGERVKRKLCESEQGAESGTKHELQCWRGASLPEVLAQQETVLLRRRQQEDEDRRVALLLQKELDQEHSATDRRKGSADAYLLRRASGGRKPPAAPPSPQTPSSGGRQTTLTHLFPNLSS